MDWVNHIIHGWVVSHEVDNLVWIILCGFHVWGESAPRTLFKKRERGQSCNYDSVWILNMGLNLFYSQCQVVGRGSSQCMPPTDS